MILRLKPLQEMKSMHLLMSLNSLKIFNGYSLGRLYEFDVSERMHCAIIPFHQGTTASVRFSGEVSDPFTLSDGTNNCVLSSLLFSFFLLCLKQHLRMLKISEISIYDK